MGIKDLVGLFEKFQVEYVLLIYCLYKKKNNQKCFTSHKVFNSKNLGNGSNFKFSP